MQLTPICRAWHFETNTMYEIAEMDLSNYGILQMSCWGQLTRISGSYSEFCLMPKSTLMDGCGHPIFSGDILKLDSGVNSLGSTFIVMGSDDWGCVNLDGVYIPLSEAIHFNHAKVIGNIWQHRYLFDEASKTA